MNAEIDISGVTLITERLIIRPWRMEDLADFYEYASVDGVGQAAGWSPHKSIDESRVILTMFIEGKNEFALECNSKAIGSLGIERYNEERFPEFETMKCREIGYVLGKYHTLMDTWVDDDTGILTRKEWQNRNPG
ncbi:MAG: GNAT family N-acetyltransferase [Solobacterium sp.]|nr:GNAT family N-acetyltransferase [Solobacterium sp.]